MKNTFCLVICSFLLLLYGCYDREILDSKEGDPIEPVANLAYTIDGNNVNLSWTLPAVYPSDIILPVSVVIKIYKNNTLISTVVVPNNPIIYTYTTYSSSSKYRIIVKVQANVDTEEVNKSKLRYSLGQTVSF
jgi:hypothetical protein